MHLINVEDPRVMEISKEWIDFLEQHQGDFPEKATTTSLGQVFLYFLMTYKPPLDELGIVVQQVLNLYLASVIDSEGSYKERMN